MDIKWPSESVAVALRANYQANGVNAADEMGSGDEEERAEETAGMRRTAAEEPIHVC